MTTTLTASWQRVTSSFTTGAATTQCYFAPIGAETGVYDVSTNVDTWGAQFEAAANGYASSYIPTSGAALTRNADVITNVASWFSTTAGTFYAQNGTEALASYEFWFEAANGANQRVGFLRNVSLATESFVISGGTTYMDIITGTVVNNSKVAIAFASNDGAAVYNGTVKGTVASLVVPSPTTLYIGTRYSSSNFLNGYIKRIAYWTSRISNANLQTLTT